MSRGAAYCSGEPRYVIESPERRTIEKLAKVFDDKGTVSCLVRDISKTGARA